MVNSFCTKPPLGKAQSFVSSFFQSMPDASSKPEVFFLFLCVSISSITIATVFVSSPKVQDGKCFDFFQAHVFRVFSEHWFRTCTLPPSFCLHDPLPPSPPASHSLLLILPPNPFLSMMASKWRLDGFRVVITGVVLRRHFHSGMREHIHGTARMRAQVKNTGVRQEVEACLAGPSSHNQPWLHAPAVSGRWRKKCVKGNLNRQLPPPI